MRRAQKLESLRKGNCLGKVSEQLSKGAKKLDGETRQKALGFAPEEDLGDP